MVDGFALAFEMFLRGTCLCWVMSLLSSGTGVHAACRAPLYCNRDFWLVEEALLLVVKDWQESVVLPIWFLVLLVLKEGEEQH